MNWLTIFRNLFDPSQLFEKTPDPVGDYLYLAIFFVACLIAAIVMGVIGRRAQNQFRKKLLGKFVYLLLFTCFTGLALIFFRWQSIPYIGSRFTMLVLFFIDLFWVIQILMYKFLIIPKEIEIKSKKIQFEKYLPRNYQKSR